MDIVGRPRALSSKCGCVMCVIWARCVSKCARATLIQCFKFAQFLRYLPFIQLGELIIEKTSDSGVCPTSSDRLYYDLTPTLSTVISVILGIRVWYYNPCLPAPRSNITVIVQTTWAQTNRLNDFSLMY